jgi:hypothetical protein
MLCTAMAFCFRPSDTFFFFFTRYPHLCVASSGVLSCLVWMHFVELSEFSGALRASFEFIGLGGDGQCGIFSHSVFSISE